MRGLKGWTLRGRKSRVGVVPASGRGIPVGTVGKQSGVGSKGKTGKACFGR